MTEKRNSGLGNKIWSKDTYKLTLRGACNTDHPDLHAGSKFFILLVLISFLLYWGIRESNVRDNSQWIWLELGMTKKKIFSPALPSYKFFIWGRYWWMPNLKAMPKWRTVREHTWKLWMQMQTWIYGKNLRNRWVINHRGLENIPLASGLVDFGPNLIVMIIIIMMMMIILYFYSDYYQ